MDGKLVVIEGIDGAGCGTQAKLLHEQLDEQGDAYFYTYPDYTRATGDLLDRFLDGAFDLTTEEQFLIYTANMVRDLDTIREQLESGATVVCDRYLTSTLAYQAVNGMELDDMLAFAELFDFPVPDLAIYLDCDVATAQERKQGEKDELDRYEEDTANQKAVDRSYHALIDDGVFAEQWAIVDAERDIGPVQDDIRELVADDGA
ncbi:MAG: dTMP kinase [Candidatus Nanohaloarchaea archaeon]|nr:dTMP kinase [Candidatus Nanohaloarchaea archaeon]